MHVANGADRLFCHRIFKNIHGPGVQRQNHGFDAREGVVVFILWIDPKQFMEGYVRVHVRQHLVPIVSREQFSHHVGVVARGALAYL